MSKIKRWDKAPQNLLSGFEIPLHVRGGDSPVTGVHIVASERKAEKY